MGILATAEPVIVICTRDRRRASAFYGEILGLALESEDEFASVFRAGGVTLRISTVPDFTPHEHTIVGFRVDDVTAIVRSLTNAGVSFQRYPHMRHDELGVCTLPGRAAQVAWFRDPDMNVLSVTNV